MAEWGGAVGRVQWLQLNHNWCGGARELLVMGKDRPLWPRTCVSTLPATVLLCTPTPFTF